MLLTGSKTDSAISNRWVALTQCWKFYCLKSFCNHSIHNEKLLFNRTAFQVSFYINQAILAPSTWRLYKLKWNYMMRYSRSQRGGSRSTSENSLQKLSGSVVSAGLDAQDPKFCTQCCR